MSRLDLVVGPNGAGRSTFVAEVIGPARTGVPFVNADVIAAQRWPDSQAEHAYEAAALAEATREALLAANAELIAETVFSDPSKLELILRAKGLGYRVVLHVVMVPVELSLVRVAARVAADGHSVPEAKIRERHARLWDNVAAAIPLVDIAFAWDNSTRDGPVCVATYIEGSAVAPPAWPTWTPAALR